MPKATLAIGIATYGPQYPQWWTTLVKMVATLPYLDIEFVGVMTAGSMMTDSNRNKVVGSFLNKTKADWLMWIDTDNPISAPGIDRLLSVQKTMVSGLYYSKRPPHTPIAYTQHFPAGYVPIKGWERGEIIPIDAAGMGALLTHRSVYTDIMDNYVPLVGWNRRQFVVHKGDIEGDLPKDQKHNMDRFAHKVYKGQIRTPVIPYDWKALNDDFPFFLIEGRRTEDMLFFEHAYRTGHKCWLDTSVEVPHIAEKEFDGTDYRAIHELDRYITGERLHLELEVEHIDAMP